MSASVNLMTEKAKFVAAGARIGNAWAAVVLGLLALLLPVSAWVWHSRAAVIRQWEALDASYEPIRQMSASNRAVSSQAAEFVTRERATLALSRSQPFVAVLNAVSSAIATTEGSAHLEGLRYDQSPKTSIDASAIWFVTLDISCMPSFDVAEIVSALNHSPFSNVRILSNTPGGAEVERKLYVLQCEL